MEKHNVTAKNYNDLSMKTTASIRTEQKSQPWIVLDGPHHLYDDLNLQHHCIGASEQIKEEVWVAYDRSSMNSKSWFVAPLFW